MKTASLTYGNVDVDASAGAPFQIMFTGASDAGGSIAAQTLPYGATQTTAFDLTPGNWTFKAQTVDSSGNPVGSAATGTYAVAAPQTVTVHIPTAIVIA